MGKLAKGASKHCQILPHLTLLLYTIILSHTSQQCNRNFSEKKGMFRKKQLFSLTLFIFSHFIIGHPRNFNCINAIALHPLFARSATFPPKGISVLILEYFIWWRMFDHLFWFFVFGIFYLMKNVWSPVWIFWFWNILFDEECLITCLDFWFWNILFGEECLITSFDFGIFYLVKNVWSPVLIF